MSLDTQTAPGRKSGTRRADVVAAVGLLALDLFLFRGAVLGRGILFRRDISLVWYPQVESFVRAVREGAWPLWDPYRGFGQPLLADPSAEILYPFTWLNLLANPWSAYCFFAVAHLFLSGLGLYLLARRLGASRGGSFTGAAAWMASGPFLSLASTWHHMAGAAWIPWCFLAGEVALEKWGLRSSLLWGASTGVQIIAGSADMVALTLLALLVRTGFLHNDLRSRAPQIARAWAVCLATGLALSAAQWLPTVDMAMGTARFGLGSFGLNAGERMAWSLHPLEILETLLPFSWNFLPLPPKAFATILEGREPWIHSIYFGIPLVVLALAGATGRTRPSRFLATIGFGAALVALGRHFPAYGVLSWLLPPLRILRYPVKAMVMVAFPLSLLAALGFDRFGRVDPKGRGWSLGVVAPALALAVFAGAAFLLASPAWSGSVLDLVGEGQVPPAMVTALATLDRRFLFEFGAAVVVLGAALWRGRRRALPCLVSVIALLDLAATHKDLHAVAPKSIITHRPELLAHLPMDKEHRVYVYNYSMAHGSGLGAPNRFILGPLPPGWSLLPYLTFAALDYLTPPVGGRWGILGSYDLDLLGLQRGALVELNERLRAAEGTPLHTRLLQLGSVCCLVDLAPPSRWEGLELSSVVKGLFPDPIRVYRVPAPLPRAYVVGSVIKADARAALDVLTGPDFDPRREVVLEDGPSEVQGADPKGSARILEERADSVVVRAELSAHGYLVLVDAYDPGWRVAVDGKKAPLLRANAVFRGVELEAGSHVVSFAYRPVSVEVGLGVTATAVALVLALLLHRPEARAA